MPINKNQYIFKGDPFVNRYRLEGELISVSPIHIGTGNERDDTDYISDKPAEENNEEYKIAEIASNFAGMPYIPGSALRGVVRNYLLQIFRSIDSSIASDEDLSKSNYSNWTQNQKVEYMKNASLLEQLFGTSFAESKIEFWDAPATQKINSSQFISRGWDEARQCYIVRSVAIDPITGAAEKHKLYSFEVTPPGLRYQVNIVGQNLSEAEVGFLLFGLYGFNSPVFPLTIGAMSGRGFGRMNFKFNKIYCLEKDGLEKWMKDAMKDEHAGYNLLPLKENHSALINKFKEAFNKMIERQS